MKHIRTDPSWFPQMQTMVQVLDASNESLGELGRADFAVAIDGKEADSLIVRSYQDEGTPLNIMLCLDVSGIHGGTASPDTQEGSLGFP